MEDKELRETLTRLVHELRQQQAKTYETVETIERILLREPTSGDQVKRLFETWAKTWRTRYTGDKYVFARVKDAAIFKRLLRALNVEDVERRMELYVRSAEPFIIAAHHPLGLFASTINQYGPSQLRTFDLVEWPIGCTHFPRCVTDQEHTKRNLREVQGDGSTGTKTPK